MHRLFVLFALLFLVRIAAAQEASPVPSGYAIALERIEAARVDSTVLSLDLMNLGLTELPPEIGDLVHIKHLYLQDNQLSSLPAEIGNLSNLETLFLADNQFSSLPIEIVNLHNLRRLDLNGNQLSTLPAEIANLNNLRTLDLGGNELSTLPAEIANLHNLTFLNLSSNQFQEFPSVLEPLGLDYGYGKLNLNNNPYNARSSSSELAIWFGIFSFGPSLIIFFTLFFLGAIVIKLRQSQK